MINEINYRTKVDRTDLLEGVKCQFACPLHIDMPVCYDLFRAGKLEEAYILLKSANPFPAITGRACLSPCEDACVRGEYDSSVAIRHLEWYLSDIIQKVSRPELATYKEGSKIGARTESVAIIGSGPAGMAAAWDLAHAGYSVTMYEKHTILGGMAHLGVPMYKIGSDVINAEFDVLKKIGVTIITGVNVGKDITLDDIKKQGTRAICLTLGADVGKTMGIEGEMDSTRVVDAISVLRMVRQGNQKKISLGNTVLIIGGGNTAIDIARTCRRIGCTNVTIMYRRTRYRMPANKLEVEAAEREGITFRFLNVPVKVKYQNETFAGLVCQKVNEDILGIGRSGPIEMIDGSEFLFEADTVIRAVSERPDLSCTGSQFKEFIKASGLIQEKLENGSDTFPGLFAAGDVITGPKSIVSALASGRRAAAGIDRYLNGSGTIYEEIPDVVTTLDAGIERGTQRLERQIVTPEIPVAIEGNFEKLSLPFAEKQACTEMNRCFRCNHSIEIEPEGCILCRCCVDVCPVNCLVMVTDKNREISEYEELYDDESGTAVLIRKETCIRCGLCVKACPENVIYFKRFQP